MMKAKPLWKLAVRVCPTAEEAVVEFLSDFFQTGASSFLHLEHQVSTVTVFLPDRSAWNLTSRHALRQHLKLLTELGLNPGRARITFERVRAEDWAESWKKHFRPLQVGPRLLIRPSWSQVKAKKGQAVVVLDPGLSFGTGQHATTGFCLAQIAKQPPTHSAQSLLDIGTGSGILAIAAAKLGYAPIAAFDFDPEAVAVAKANAARNRVTNKIHIYRGDVAQLKVPSRKTIRTGRNPSLPKTPPGYDLVVANLTANLLQAQLNRILACVVPGGVLVLAGILKTEFATIRAACVAAGLKPLAARTEKEWRSGSFLKPKDPTVESSG
jgi:ribosomal protein L11 methyltransferase